MRSTSVRHGPSQGVEVGEFERDAESAGQGQQMDDRVGRSADGGDDSDGVLERHPSDDRAGPEPLLDQGDDSLPGALRCFEASRVDSRPRR
jgi:hypothetical protein